MQKGDKVHYVPYEGCDEHLIQNGIIKTVRDEDNFFVVYNCNEDWDNYEDYGSQLTNVKYLKNGWKEDEKTEAEGDLCMDY